MKTVLANAEISFKGIEILEHAGYKIINQHYAKNELIEVLNKEGITVLYASKDDIDVDFLNACPKLEVVGCKGHHDISSLKAKYPKIKFIETHTASSQSKAELVFAHLLGMVRFLYDSNRQMPLEGEVNFDGMHQAYSNGIEIKGKTLGLIGFGPDAQETAKMALALGLKVLVFDKEIVKKTITLEFAQGVHVDFEIETTSIEEILMKSDFVSMHVLAEDNVVIGKEEFELMKMGACLVNISDAGVVNEVELMKALDSGIVKHAALDCFDNQPKPDMRILMNPNISLSPNIASKTKDVIVKEGETFAHGLIDLDL